jgi:sigma-B regulation protein RsbU (phosphoserine phosphatase)
LPPNWRCEEQILELEPGDRVFLSTDGVIEAENDAGQEFGVGRMPEALDRNRRSPLSEGLTSVLACAGRWCAPADFADDVSMLALEICGTKG